MEERQNINCDPKKEKWKQICKLQVGQRIMMMIHDIHMYYMQPFGNGVKRKIT